MNNIKSIVNKLVHQYATSDPFELANYLNIKIIIDKMPLSIRGFYSNVLGLKFIYLNSILEESQMTNICAHELGHAVLHTYANAIFLSHNTFVVPSKLELQADIFAAHLRIKDETLLQFCDETITIDCIAAKLNLPVKMLDIKYKHLS